ncbi:HAMP domain-containing sensor histidine kinase [Spirochaeta isovalerica]|uniref:histidine kinase n=1 Tax=Spirochaeta isovalerica TaxID=150 RepID=A0A841RC44_9SPIO|nr:HAMP domain-containing sensor histidine kinase [Spirochaeta isovalerica]MBB6480797.1 two-component system sensor histidine kinase BaeS [Spirochaeta isovalerica]
MLKKADTLFARILFSFILIIILTMSVSIVTEYFSAVNEMPGLLTDVRSKSAALQIADNYSRDKSWDFLNSEVFRQSGFQRSEGDDDLHLRYIVKDSSGRTVYNSFSILTEKIDIPLREGNSSVLRDSGTGEPIGTLTVYISSLYVDREAEEYILSVFKTRVFQSLLVLFIAVIVAAILSAWISRPVRELTRAAEKLAQKGESSHLPASYSGELGRMTEAFNSMIDALNKQKSLRKNLIRNVSHDIATPLNVIRLEARGLLDGLSSPETGSTLIIREVDKLKNFVNDLNWLAETDSGEYRLQKELCSLEELAESEVSRWDNQAAASGIGLKLILPDAGIPPVSLDRIRITEALGNLIENAIKYSGTGKTVEITLSRENSYALLTVRDRGPGLERDEQSRVFDRFYRGRLAESGTVDGRGLGLSIVRQIAELHGGKAEVFSRPGKGSSFTLSIPL